MTIQALHRLYTRLAEDASYEIAPPGFSPQKISFRIVLRLDGSLVEPQDARVPDEKKKLQNDVRLVPGEAKPSGAGINPCFLWDNQTYLLGRQPEDKPAGFGQKRFEAFRQRHLELEKSINLPEFSAVCRFLESWQPERLAEFSLLAELATGFGIFQISGEKKAVHDLPAIQNWWIESLTGEGKVIRGRCSITNEEAPIARLHPKIKGVVGAQAAGASLVSFNDTAYESYLNYPPHDARGPQGRVSPVSETVAFRYGTALNSLLTGPQSRKHRLRIGDTTAVFWTEKPTLVENCLADLFAGGSQMAEDEAAEGASAAKRQQLQRLLEAVRDGTHYEDFGGGDVPFYILGLAPNAARLAIRFFHQSTVEDLLSKLHEHQRCFAMVRQFTEKVGNRFPDPEMPAIWQILRETARVADDIPPLLGGALTRAIVEGTPYPEGLYTAILRRLQADRTVSYLRAATLKAVLVRNHQLSIPTMLDPENTDPAYLLGRLFAALEKTQEDALGNVNAGIRDRFYSAASATPASVFPKLLRTYQHHLSKLSPGGKVHRDRQVQDIVWALGATGFPRQFALANQGIFAIGYYHQRKDFFTRKEEAPVEADTAAAS